METKTLNQAKQNNLLKKYVKQRFGLKISIRTSNFAGGSSMNIDYDLGCSPKEIEKFFNNLQYGDFDGMTDSYNNRNEASSGMIIEGVEMNDFKYVFVKRDIPVGLKFQMAIAISKYSMLEGMPELITMEDYYRSVSVPRIGFISWAEIVQRQLNKLNFVSQDETTIKIVNAFLDETGSWMFGFHFVYEFDGKEYSTNEYSESVPEMKKASQAEKNDIHLVDYSERAIAVYGKTYELREIFKKIGGKFNKNLKDGAGWIFSKSLSDQVSDAIINYHSETK